MVANNRALLTLIPLAMGIIGALCHDPRFQTGSQLECPIRKMEIDNYEPQGRNVVYGNISFYETLDQTPRRLLIAAYDIFGDTKNSRKFVDLLAEAYGFRIVLPDFYRGEPWDHTKWPPIPDEYSEWSTRVANWDTVVQYDVDNILNLYNEVYNITEAGIFGFCWGGMVSTKAAIQMSDRIKAAGLVHPSSVNNDMANDVNAPMYLFPCSDDPDMLPFYEVLKSKFGDNSGHRRYDDMCHGFATSMGNFSDPLLWQRVEQTIDILGNFFVRNLPNLP